MSVEPEERRGPSAGRRVVLMVDTAERARVLAREAARVAMVLGATLEGCFVEDEELLRWAGHGFARRFGSAARPRAVEAKELEHEWRALALEVRRCLAAEAARCKLEADFRVTREDAARVMDAAGPRDVLVVGWGGFAPRAGRTAPVRVLHDGSAAAARALSIAAQLAGPEGRLAVLLPPGASAASIPGGALASLGVLALADLEPATVREAVAREPGGLLLVPAGTVVARRLAERSMSARFGASVLVIR